ncbi:hypothetical protein [Mycolicibacterium celeriflavum]|uniref:hypothetical protein n=1 Tax=Mycolicibacterium celeriflavum TaxID=1249101 RepID=UPI003CE9C57A
MAETVDAAARLADGLPGVADIEQYVLACQCLGYRHPDLTTHPAQVRDWYAAEDGMDLGALEADCAGLQAVASAAEDALARQEAQLEALTTAWQGLGANASREFLHWHGEAAAAAATAVRKAASALDDLRERLWASVDDKVARAVSIGDDVGARRGDWLAASQTVTTGTGDRAVASELVDQEVKPFVDAVIAGEWLAAMRTTTDAIEAAYELATAELAPHGEAVFDVPGDLGPSWIPSGSADGTTPVPAPITNAAPAAIGAAPAPVAPAGWAAPAALSPPPPTAPPAVELPASAAPPSAEPLPPQSAPPLPSLGGGLPDLGGGLSDFGQQLGDLLGGLLGEGALDDASLDDLTEPDLDDEAEFEPDEGAGETEEEEDEEGGEEEEGEEDEAEEAEDVATEPVAEPLCETEPPPSEVAAPPEEPPVATVPPEPVAESAELQAPLPSPEAPNAGTPCEIAADELPQVGE